MKHTAHTSEYHICSTSANKFSIVVQQNKDYNKYLVCCKTRSVSTLSFEIYNLNKSKRELEYVDCTTAAAEVKRLLKKIKLHQKEKKKYGKFGQFVDM